MITAEQALDALEKAVALKGPDYVYTDQATGIRADSEEWHGTGIGCRYAGPDGEPACIVGTALSIIDQAVFDVVRECEAEEGSFPVIDLCEGTGDVPVVVAAADAVWVFRCAQVAQDGGATWGEALKAAREYATEIEVVA